MTLPQQDCGIARSLIKKVLFPFIYPPNCLTCDNFCHDPELMLCGSCVDLLELLDPLQRCPRCFFLIDPLKTMGCRVCRKLGHPFSGLASAFDFTGPPALLVGQLNYQRRRFLAKSLAACLILQFDRLNWPLPDVVMSAPVPVIETIFWGAGANELIAREVAGFLGRPYVGGLKFAGGFHLKNTTGIRDKTILLIEDAIKTGESLFACGRALLEGYPKRMYALAVCLNPSLYSEINEHGAADAEHS